MLRYAISAIISTKASELPAIVALSQFITAPGSDGQPLSLVFYERYYTFLHVSYFMLHVYLCKSVYMCEIVR